MIERSAPVSNRNSAAPPLMRTVTIGILPNEWTENSVLRIGLQVCARADDAPAALASRTTREAISRQHLATVPAPSPRFSPDSGDDSDTLNFDEQFGTGE